MLEVDVEVLLVDTVGEGEYFAVVGLPLGYDAVAESASLVLVHLGGRVTPDKALQHAGVHFLLLFVLELGAGEQDLPQVPNCVAGPEREHEGLVVGAGLAAQDVVALVQRGLQLLQVGLALAVLTIG